MGVNIQSSTQHRIGRIVVRRGKAAAWANVDATHRTHFYETDQLSMQHSVQHLMLMDELRKEAANSAPDFLPGPQSHVCVVIRTYWAHGSSSPTEPGPLQKLLGTLQASNLSQ